ncbi:hypothetical protein C3K23_25165 [Streptomyces sp. 604F]|nr:hypothetical protein C3K23_25165 [Streptomyces sp. 604F]
MGGLWGAGAGRRRSGRGAGPRGRMGRTGGVCTPRVGRRFGHASEGPLRRTRRSPRTGPPTARITAGRPPRGAPSTEPRRIAPHTAPHRPRRHAARPLPRRPAHARGAHARRRTPLLAPISIVRSRQALPQPMNFLNSSGNSKSLPG